MSWHKCPAGYRAQYRQRGGGSGELLLFLGPGLFLSARVRQAWPGHAALPGCAETRLLHHSEACRAGAAGPSVPVPGHWAREVAQSSIVPAGHTTPPQFPTHRGPPLPWALITKPHHSFSDCDPPPARPASGPSRLSPQTAPNALPPTLPFTLFAHTPPLTPLLSRQAAAIPQAMPGERGHCTGLTS